MVFRTTSRIYNGPNMSLNTSKELKILFFLKKGDLEKTYKGSKKHFVHSSLYYLGERMVQNLLKILKTVQKTIQKALNNNVCFQINPPF